MIEAYPAARATYTVDGKNIVILQGFKEYFALGFFQGALLKDPRKVLVQLGQVHAGRVMKFTSVKEIKAQAATIQAYVREAIAIEQAGLRMEPKKTSDFPVPEELTEQFRKDPRLKRHNLRQKRGGGTTRGDSVLVESQQEQGGRRQPQVRSSYRSWGLPFVSSRRWVAAGARRGSSWHSTCLEGAKDFRYAQRVVIRLPGAFRGRQNERVPDIES